MKSLKALFPLLLAAGIASAQTAPAPERAPGYDPLEGFVGRWTTQGREAEFLEVCAWYHGKFHVVCNSQSKRADGSVGHSMSILSFVPGSGYVYSGIGSKGRYETFDKGRWSDGKFFFDKETVEDGKTVMNRISIGPFTDKGFLFVVSTSPDGVTWTELDTTIYLRVK